MRRAVQIERHQSPALMWAARTAKHAVRYVIMDIFRKKKMLILCSIFQ